MNQISKTHLDDLRATVAIPSMSGGVPEPVRAEDETEILAPDGQERAIGERLAQARKGAKLSKAAMSKAIGRRGAQVITDYETGTSKVSLGTVRQIAAATGADVTWLWLGKALEQPATRPDKVPPPGIDDISSPDDSRLLAAIADGIVQRRRWTDARTDQEHASILLDWNRTGRVRSNASIAACVPNTLAGLRAKADYVLENWRREQGTPDAFARLQAGAMATLDQAMDRLMATPVAPAAVAPDAELIALCARHDAFLAEANRIGNADTLPDNADAEIQRLTGEAGEIGQTIVTMRATTPAGIVALARSTAAAADGMLVDNDTDPLLQMLFRDSLALGSAHAVPATAPSAEITTAIAAVTAARAACDRVDVECPADEEACDATASAHSDALDACGSVRIATLADASAIAALALRYLAADDISGQGDVVTRGLLESLARYTPDAPNPDAGIIARCDQVVAAWNDYWRLCDEHDALPVIGTDAFEEKHLTPAYNRACDIYDAIKDGPVPKTAEGLRAVARAAIYQASDARPQGPYTVEMTNVGSELAWKLVGHLAGLEVRPLAEAA